MTLTELSKYCTGKNIKRVIYNSENDESGYIGGATAELIFTQLLVSPFTNRICLKSDGGTMTFSGVTGVQLKTIEQIYDVLTISGIICGTAYTHTLLLSCYETSSTKELQ